MEGNSTYRVFDIIDEAHSFSGSLGMSDERHDEVATVVSEAINQCNTFSSAAELVTRYATSANDLFFMGVMIGQALLHQRTVSSKLEGLEGLLEHLKKLKGDD